MVCRLRAVSVLHRGSRLVPAAIPAPRPTAPRSATRAGSPPSLSPRVRGTQPAPSAEFRPRRFIPACAGNSARWRLRRGPAPVHPRVCGELSRSLAWRRVSAGSSPRVRGTPLRGRASAEVRRFIPACAGNSKAGQAVGESTTVHPRVCGNSFSRTVPVSVESVHPRVCGELVRVGARHRLGHRFIPACAGNSRSKRSLRA